MLIRNFERLRATLIDAYLWLIKMGEEIILSSGHSRTAMETERPRFAPALCLIGPKTAAESLTLSQPISLENSNNKTPLVQLCWGLGCEWFNHSIWVQDLESGRHRFCHWAQWPWAKHLTFLSVRCEGHLPSRIAVRLRNGRNHLTQST